MPTTTPIGLVMRHQQQRIRELEERLLKLERLLSPPALPACPTPPPRSRRRPIAVGCHTRGKTQVIDLTSFETALSTGATAAQLMELAMADAKRAFVTTMETRTAHRTRPANPFAGIPADARLLPPGA